MSVLEQTNAAVASASHLTDMDVGAVEALRLLAAKIDNDEALRAAYLDRGSDVEGERKPLQLDNVSIPTYLKFCDALGLTPAGRVKLEGRAAAAARKAEAGSDDDDGSVGGGGDAPATSTLGRLRALHGGKAPAASSGRAASR